MVPSLVRLMALAGLLIMAGCAVTPPVSTLPKEYPPVEIEDSSPVASLLEAARQARSRQDNSAAGRYLERALGMAGAGEATVLYRELADLRLAEGQPRAAEGMLMRALRDAPENPDWRAGLWDMLALARQRQGNSEGSAAAKDEAKALREQTTMR